MNYYNKITEALSGASRAYRRAWKKHDKYASKAASLHDKELASDYRNKRSDQMDKISKTRKLIPRSPKREADRAANYWNKFGKHGL